MLHPLAKFKPYLVLKILPQRNCDSKRGSADHHTGDPMDASLREGHTKRSMACWTDIPRNVSQYNGYVFSSNGFQLRVFTFTIWITWGPIWNLNGSHLVVSRTLCFWCCTIEIHGSFMGSTIKTHGYRPNDEGDHCFLCQPVHTFLFHWEHRQSWEWTWRPGGI